MKKSKSGEKKSSSSKKNKKRTLSDVEDGELSDKASFSSSDESSVFNDGYDSDLIGDEEDRRRLDTMTEKEREEEIYRRTEQRDLLMKQFEMRKKISRKQKEEARMKRRDELKKKKKSKAQVSSEDESSSEDEEDEIAMRANGIEMNDPRGDSDDKQNELNNRRKVNESKKKNTDVSKALANLKADREKKKQQAEDQRQKLEKLQQQQKKLRTEDVFSSSDDDNSSSSYKQQKKSHQGSSQNRHSSSESSDDMSDDSSDSDNDSDASSEDDAPKRFIEKKDDLNKIKLSRFRIEKWCHAKFFKDVACGCFVRIGIGLNQGIPIYRVAEVIDVVETAKVYPLGTTKTNKGFKLRHGQEERTYRLEFVSNQPFTDDEFSRWKDNLIKHDIPLPTMKQVETKSKELKSFIDYRFKDEDLDHIIQEKKKFVKDNDKIAERKIDLLKQREEAVQANEPERVKDIDVMIEQLNEKAIDINTKRSGNFNLLAAINQRNREKSNQAVEEAMKNEFARLKEAKDDPFQRRRALPTLVAASIKKTTSSQELTKPPSQDKKPEEKKTESPASSQMKKIQSIPLFEDIIAPKVKPTDEIGNKPEANELNRSGMLNSTVHSDDLFHAHNFDININLPIPLQTNQMQSTSMMESGVGLNNLSRRSLNLDEYKKKKGLI